MLQNNIQFKDQEFLKPKDFTKLCGITYQTFWNWVKANKISVVKTQTNKYLISKSELLRLNLIKVKNINKINIIYARVSSTKQKDDLNRQIERLTKFCVVNNIKITPFLKYYFATSLVFNLPINENIKGKKIPPTKFPLIITNK